jgi:hypothetical protein
VSALKFSALWLKGDERSNTILATIRSPLLQPSWIDSNKACQLELLIHSNGFGNIEVVVVLEQPSHVSTDVHRLADSVLDRYFTIDSQINCNLVTDRHSIQGGPLNECF